MCINILSDAYSYPGRTDARAARRRPHGRARRAAPTARRRRSDKSRVAIAGATGYTGQELLRILGRHPSVSVTAAMSSGSASGSARPLPALARLWDGQITPLSADTLARDADIVFLALPDSAAAELGPSLVEAGVRVIDLSGAFRLRDAAARARWYPETHRMPDGVAYGLTEREREAVAGARLVANPGCYPTAALLALAPLVSAGILTRGRRHHRRRQIRRVRRGEDAVGADAFFRVPRQPLGLRGLQPPPRRRDRAGDRRPGSNVTFTPHLVPLDRGLMATIYVRVAPGTTEQALAEVFERAYAGATFVRLVGSSLPEIKHVAHTNFCDIGWRVDPSGRAILVSVIDNLLKGASGQAVQNMNVMLGLDERTGLL